LKGAIEENTKTTKEQTEELKKPIEVEREDHLLGIGGR